MLFAGGTGMACKGSGVQIPSAPPPHQRRSAPVSRAGLFCFGPPFMPLGHVWGTKHGEEREHMRMVASPAEPM